MNKETPKYISYESIPYFPEVARNTVCGGCYYSDFINSFVSDLRKVTELLHTAQMEKYERGRVVNEFALEAMFSEIRKGCVEACSAIDRHSKGPGCSQEERSNRAHFALNLRTRLKQQGISNQSAWRKYRNTYKRIDGDFPILKIAGFNVIEGWMKAEQFLPNSTELKAWCDVLKCEPIDLCPWVTANDSSNG